MKQNFFKKLTKNREIETFHWKLKSIIVLKLYTIARLTSPNFYNTQSYNG